MGKNYRGRKKMSRRKSEKRPVPLLCDGLAKENAIGLDGNFRGGGNFDALVFLGGEHFQAFANFADEVF